MNTLYTMPTTGFTQNGDEVYGRSSKHWIPALPGLDISRIPAPVRRPVILKSSEIMDEMEKAIAELENTVSKMKGTLNAY